MSDILDPKHPKWGEYLEPPAKECPREPTQEMMQAIGNRLGHNLWMDYNSASAIWRAMYDAAPAQEPPDSRLPNIHAPLAEWQRGKNYAEVEAAIRHAMDAAGYTGVAETNWPLPAPWIIAYWAGAAHFMKPAPAAVPSPDDDALIARLPERAKVLRNLGFDATAWDCEQAAARLSALKAEQDDAKQWQEIYIEALDCARGIAGVDNDATVVEALGYLRAENAKLREALEELQ